MFCEPCGRERPFSRFCVLCGSALIERATPLIEADLDRVRWLLDEVSAWDESLAPRSARQAIGEYYRRQEDALCAALAPAPPAPVPARPTPPELTHPPLAPPPSPPELPAVVLVPPPPPEVRPAEPLAPRPPPRPSGWQRT